MTPYFRQLLVNIDTPKAQAAEALNTLAAAAAVICNSKSAATTSSNSHNNNTQGNFSVLPQIDRKLVFTPAYDIVIANDDIELIKEQESKIDTEVKYVLNT